MKIGIEIKTRRSELNITQEDLAKKLNVSRSAISNWEQQRNYPDIELLVAISDELDISLDKLLRGDSKMVKELSLNYKKKKRYKVLMAISILIIIILCGYIYAITNTERYYRYNPFAKLNTGYAILPTTVTYNGGNEYNPYESEEGVRQIADPYTDIKVIDKDTLDKTILTFTGGQSPKNENFGKITYKKNYVYKLEFISWESIPEDVQKKLKNE